MIKYCILMYYITYLQYIDNEYLKKKMLKDFYVLKKKSTFSENKRIKNDFRRCILYTSITRIMYFLPLGKIYV